MSRVNVKLAAVLLASSCAWPMLARAGLSDLKESNHFVDITVDTKKGYARVKVKESSNAQAIYEALQVAPVTNAEGVSIKNVQTVQGDQRMQFVCWKNATAPYGCEIKMDLGKTSDKNFRVHLAQGDKLLILRTDNERYDAARVMDQALPKDEGRVEVRPGTDPQAGVSVNGGLAYIVPPDPPAGSAPKPRFQLKSIRDDKNGKVFFDIVVTRPLNLGAAQETVDAAVERSAPLAAAGGWE